MFLECFDCGTEMEINIEISDNKDPKIAICPVCQSEDIEISKYQ